jgi:hypothetical protein
MVNSKDKATTKGVKNLPAEGRQKATPFERERAQFKALLLGNPNYFGNLEDSEFKPALKIQGDTTYEQIGCVGFQPQFNRLEAVVFVKQQGGYGGGLCSNGSQEYVRFYLSNDNGATWQDEGVTSFTAYDIPANVTHRQRLEYAVTLDIKPRRKFCFNSNIVLVRAILSWNIAPPPNRPNYTPVWGNVHNTHIQIAPRTRLILGELFDELKLQIPVEFSAAVDLKQEVSAAQPQPLGAAELQRLYVDTKVEPHRFALAEAHKLLTEQAGDEALAAGIPPLAKLGLHQSDIFALVSNGDGNTNYEELECVGLNPNLDTLVGTIRVKQPAGYSGNLCSAGSREYVTFWADFDNNGSFETCLGTTSVLVHDIRKMPREGLEYAVFLPVDFTKWRRPCRAGAVVVRIRAILSWQIPPPCSNPNFVPVWGNREETLIHIRPGQQTNPGTHTPFIETVGGMRVSRINNVSGLANGAADTAGFTAFDSPFGGEVIIAGHIAYPTNSSAGAAHLKYKVSLSGDGGASWQAQTDPFPIGRTQFVGGVAVTLPDSTQSVDGNNYYEYREDLTGNISDALIFVTGNVLFRWQTGGLTGIWKIKIEAIDPAQPAVIFNSNVVTVRLDNAAPVLGLDITSGGGVCADFTIGEQISGTYSASDEHLGGLSLTVEPSLGGVFTAPAGTPGASSISRSYPTVPTTGEAGNWTLDTTGMPRCGYIIRLSASDRTIVNSGFVGSGNDTVVGLCLRQPGT